MKEEFERTAMMLTEYGVKRLRESRVAVFGIGGVGSAAAEALARSGVGTLELVDSDRVSLSNINRQLIALHSTVGMMKTEAAKKRIEDISPETSVICRDCFFLPENAGDFDFASYDFVIDAVDTVSAKTEIAVRCRGAGTPLVSCMGTGNKTDPTRFRVTDIYSTHGCPLARVMRHELRKRGITELCVVFSDEPAAAAGPRGASDGRRPVPGALPVVPPVAGFIAAGVAIKRLSGLDG